MVMVKVREDEDDGEAKSEVMFKFPLICLLRFCFSLLLFSSQSVSLKVQFAIMFFAERTSIRSTTLIKHIARSS